MLQFRPGGPFYRESDVGWVFRRGSKHVCFARDVQVGDLLPNCEIRDDLDHSIRVLIQVKEIVQIPPTF